jgi:hypothetical protein
VFVFLGAIIGAPLLAHGVYRALVRDWREREWWRERQWLAVAIGGLFPVRRRPGQEVVIGIIQAGVGLAMLLFAFVVALPATL